MKNRVAKIVSEEKIEIFEEEIPVLKDGQVLVKLKAVGICGSDLHFFRHCGLGSFKNPLPIDIGHEPAGEVVESKAHGFLMGDKVAIEPGLVCLNCQFCVSGRHHLCEKVKFLGANDIGAFRDFIILEPERLMRADGLSFEKAALLEPLGVALHAVERVKLKIGSRVGILGSGTIGLCLASVLSQMGCYVTTFDPLEYRTQFSLKIGANYCVYGDAGTKFNFDVVFDAAGTQDSFTKSMKYTGPGGQVCIVGIPEVDLFEINPHQMRVKELTLTNSRRSNQKLRLAYEIALGTIASDEHDIEKLVTHKMPLEDIQKGFEIASKYQDGVIKVMITG